MALQDAAGAADRLTLGALVRRQAMHSPDRDFLRMAEGTLTFSQFHRASNRLAHGLAARGVCQRDIVAIMLPNCLDYVVGWFAIEKLGAVSAAINTAFRGPGLAHVLSVAKCRVLIVDETFLDAVAAVAGGVPTVETLVVRGNASSAEGRFPGWEVVPYEEVSADDDREIDLSLSDTDLAMLLFTSGTTGRSKACMLSHRFVLFTAEAIARHLHFSSEDVLYCPFPLFHADATYLTIVPSLVVGCTAAIGVRFSVSHFWDEIRQFNATVFDFMGATLELLWKRQPQAGDRDNPVRLAWGVPLPKWAPQAEERFGFKLVDGYGSTEVGVPICRPVEGAVPAGSCGKAVPPYDVRVVDDRDEELPDGEVGEMVIRSDLPWTLMDGYFGMPEATVAAFRNQWFHTGDVCRRDGEGFIYFVGRKKDSIRRRGENISAFEVEEVINSHAAVSESAAFGVPSDLSEEEIKVCVVLRAGHTLAPEDLVAYCRRRMARFMVPRYIEFRSELPRTPTQKVEKYRLAAEGVTAATWDRECPSAT